MQHTFGWPLDNSTGGGSFLYHFDDNLVSVGFVVHLNYTNPYLSPFDEFQRFKTHPLIATPSRAASASAYGARAITEGGWQSVPKLTFPGGALIGCAAGFVNVPRIKGSHNAMLSGMLAAEHVAAALAAGRAPTTSSPTTRPPGAARRSGSDLWRVRNAKPLWSKLGTIARRRARRPRHVDATRSASRCSARSSTASRITPRSSRAAECQPIAYPKPDGKLTFDRLSSVFLSNTNHEEDQPAASRGDGHGACKRLGARRLCRAVGALLPGRASTNGSRRRGKPRFVINAQNCVHCKTCDIKDPNQNITWVPPEGGGGPNYPNM